MISVIVCTHNRADTLKECLLAIEGATSIEGLEKIVIDNASTDHTQSVVQEFPDWHYYYEPQVGLSHARNTAVDVASRDWVFFIDDDAMVKRDIFIHARHSIQISSYKLISGIFKARYPIDPPYWIPYHIGNYGKHFEPGLQDIGSYYVAGGVMLIHRPTLIKVGTFPSEYGMSGKKIGYGEESFVEQQFRKAGIPVGLNPNMVIYHQVLPHKYKLSWMLKSAYAHGRYSLHPRKFSSLLWLMVKQILKIAYYSCISILKWKIDYRLIKTLMVLWDSFGRVQQKVFNNN